MRHTKSAGGIVVNKKGEVLVVSQRGTSWSLPKGHADPGEDFYDAARREIHEESGISDLTFIKELGDIERYRISKDPREDDLTELKVIKIFLFTTKEMSLKPSDPENPEARWVAVDKVSTFLTHKKDREFFEAVREKERDFFRDWAGYFV